MAAQKADSAADLIEARATPWQQALVQRLLQVQRGRGLPHALLINPRTAVDSRAFGWYLATALLCQHEDADQAPCGSCGHCQLMRANSYPDFTFTTLVHNERPPHKLNRDIRIDQIRHLIHQLALTASQSSGKMALVYPAERMNQSSANSLLKTLEEPASGSILILLSHNPGRLPVTIRSRCQQWSVPRPEAPQALDWLTQQQMPTDQQADYLELAAGDVELALQLHTDQALDHLTRLQQAVKSYLGGHSDVTAVRDSVDGLDDGLLRLIVRRVLQSFVYQQATREASAGGRRCLQALLDLMQRADRVLQSQETNLILQLQLEDVLISLKQILTGENQHGRTRQPGHTVT